MLGFHGEWTKPILRLKVKGQWVYLYRTVDKEGKTVDFMLSAKRDEPAARAFFEKAIGSNGLPDKVTMDKSGANKAGIELHHMLKKGQHTQSANQTIFEQFYGLAA